MILKALLFLRFHRRRRIKNNWMLVQTCSLETWMRMWMKDYYMTRLVLSV